MEQRWLHFFSVLSTLNVCNATYKDVIVKIVIVAFRQNVPDKVHFIWKLTNDCLATKMVAAKSMQNVFAALYGIYNVAIAGVCLFHWIWGDWKQRAQTTTRPK